MSALGHSRPSHFVPVLNNVRYASDSDHSRYESELSLWANKRHRRMQHHNLTEPLGASLTLRIGKIAIERKADILRQGVDAKMIALGRLAALSHMVEGSVQLRQVFDFNHQMKLTKWFPNRDHHDPRRSLDDPRWLLANC